MPYKIGDRFTKKYTRDAGVFEIDDVDDVNKVYRLKRIAFCNHLGMYLTENELTKDYHKTLK